MENESVPRHQLIEKLMAQHTEKVADASIGLWEQMAPQIISIIGEEGVNSRHRVISGSRI